MVSLTIMKKFLNPVASILTLLLWFSGTSFGASMAVKTLPESLQPWVAWVLHDDKQARCPMVFNQNDQRICAWPSRLELYLEANSGRFTQEWQVSLDGWIPLPGGKEQWPQEVMVDGEKLPLLPTNDQPGLWLKEGVHRIEGQFQWKSLPEFLPIPAISGLVTLTLNGSAVSFPNLDPQGRLWLHPKQKETREEDRLELTVHRLIQDGVPVEVESRLNLRISGKNREIFLPSPLNTGLIPLSLESDLPVRVETDGRLRVQARPGQWLITLKQRSREPVSQFQLPADLAPPWPDEEVWAFKANNRFRIVTVSEAQAVDPQQTLLPEIWRQYPTFRLKPGDRMVFKEKKRGDPDPDSDRLDLNRTIWLDFDGGGYTLQDHVQGRSSRSWRMEMNAPTELGRVTVNGQDQFITRLSGAAKSGVEIRTGQLQLSADSRLPANHGVVPAVGWDADFQKVTAYLHLPPGWRMFHASGADWVSPTWVSQWTLLDIFLVLVVSLGVTKLWGRFWGLLAFITMGLAYHEVPALVVPLLNLMAAVALLRVVTRSNLPQRLLKLWQRGSLLVLIVVALPFLVDQARQGIYPQLEDRSGPQIDYARGNSSASSVAPAEVSMAEPEAAMEAPMVGKAELAEGRMALSARSAMKSAGSYDGYSRAKQRKLAQIHPKTQVQTGPGVPQWQWLLVTISWNGPVERGQELRFYLIPPWLHRIFMLARILLVLALIGRVAETSLPRSGKVGTKNSLVAVMGFVLALGIGLHSHHALAEMPSPELLQELKKRLTEPPECLPVCADLLHMRLEADGNQLRIQLQVHAAAGVAVPLPGRAADWLPSKVLVDGHDARHLKRDGEGSLWVLLPLGIHHLLLEGALPAREVLPIALPLKPRKVEAVLNGWEVDGIHDNGLADSSLQLRRLQQRTIPAGGESDATAVPETLPPFLQVTRHLILDLTWQVETIVTRLTNLSVPVALEVPLLPGESVTDSHVRVVGKKALVHLSANQRQLSWHSLLEVSPEISLAAPQTTLWSEQWQLEVSPIWHVTLAGIPVIEHMNPLGHRQPQWHPWPGEHVVIHVSRPEGVPGPTLTLEKSALSAHPGLRATDVSLNLHLRSGQGGEHVIQLPEGAVLLSTTIRGREEPIRQNGQKVTLPISPGFQEITLRWRQSGGMLWSYQSPRVNLGLVGVNHQLEIRMPAERWLLWTRGPTLGPAILYWGFLLVIVLLSLAAGRISWLPMRAHHWLLLGLGLSTVPVATALILVSWFLLFGRRSTWSPEPPTWRFNGGQIVLIFWSFLALMALLTILNYGLLGYPDMQVAGNHSTRSLLRWFQDRTGVEPPQGWVISVPILIYRLLMLAWSLWLATALMGWIRWGWQCFSSGGLWYKAELAPAVKSQNNPTDAEKDKEIPAAASPKATTDVL